MQYQCKTVYTDTSLTEKVTNIVDQHLVFELSVYIRNSI